MKIKKTIAAGIALTFSTVFMSGNAIFAADSESGAIMKDQYYENWTKALEVAEEGDTIKLLKDFAYGAEGTGEEILINKDVTIDLNGKTIDIGNRSIKSENDIKITDTNQTKGKITSKNNTFIITESGSLTIDGAVVESTSTNHRTIETNGDLTVNNGKIYGVNGAIEAIGTGGENSCDVTIDGSDTLIEGSGSGASDGIFVERNCVLTINDGTVYGRYYGIDGNGTNSSTEPSGYLGGTTININGGTVKGIYGMYIPQNGTVNINGGTIDGVQAAIEIESGILKITKGNLSASSNECVFVQNSSGPTVSGAAVAVVCRTAQGKNGIGGGGYSGNMEINISGGTLKGVYGLAKYLYTGMDEASSIKEMNITGGTFIGSGDGIDMHENPVQTKSVYAHEGLSNKFITGGTYSTDVSEYTRDGYTCLEDEDNYVVYENIDSTYDGNLVNEVNKDSVNQAMEENFGEGSSNSYRLDKITVKDISGNTIRVQYDVENKESSEHKQWNKEFTGTTFTDADVIIGIILYNIPKNVTVSSPEVYIQ